MPSRTEEAFAAAAEILRLQRVRADFAAQKEEIQRQIETIDSEIAAQQGKFAALVGDGRGEGPRVIHRRSGTAVDGIVEALRSNRGVAMDAEELLTRLRGGGVEVEISTIRATLLRLYKNNLLERVDRGKYRAPVEPAPVPGTSGSGLNGSAHLGEEATV
jgi:hypothetical protein